MISLMLDFDSRALFVNVPVCEKMCLHRENNLSDV